VETLTKYVTDSKDIDVYFDIFSDQNPPKEAIDYFQFHYEKNFSGGANVLDDIRLHLGKMGYESIIKRADVEFTEYMENSLYGDEKGMR